MSVESSYYVIGGYDLTDFKMNEYDDWKWTEQGETYFNNQIKLFDDPISGLYLYLGYIFASGDEYDFNTTCFSVSDIEKHRDEVKIELFKLIDMSIISPKAAMQAEFKIIAFEEFR